MQPSTHLAIDPRLCGAPLALSAGAASVVLTTLPEMAADARGLVHGGFVFGLADYAAMLAINQPNVVLGSAEVKLVAPVIVGDSLRADAQLLRSEGKKQIVEVHVFCSRAEARASMLEQPDAGSSQGERVFVGTFVCFVPGAHVLDRKAAP
jgi:acyl-coenzyme A thioesterase PaaI-like protein